MRRKMFKKNNLFCLIKSNKGSTLIEVIVCVLIIGIAFVPLMVGLNASLRINKDTENKLYAENVASNIVEICKTYGKQGLEELKDLNSDTSKGIKAFLAGSAVTLAQDSTDDTKFYIRNISSGMEDKNYYAVIEFDETAYEGAQNDFSAYQSISGLTDAVVVGFETDILENVVHKFFEVSDTTDSSVTEAAMVEHVEDWLKRQITIDIKPIMIDDTTRYVVDAKIEYFAEGTAMVNGSSIFAGSEITSVVYQSQPYAKRTVNKTSGPSVETLGSAPELENYKQVPKSVIVTYSQLKSSTGNTYSNLGFPASNPYDMIVNMGVSGEKTNVYALCMDVAALTPLTNYKMKSQTIGNWGSGSAFTTGVYSNLNSVDPANPSLSSMYYTNCAILTHFGDGSTGKQSKLKDVTVTVKNCDSAGAPIGDTVIEKTSTVIEFE